MTEIEAKFIIRRPEQIDEALRVLAAQGFAISPRGTSSHVDSYYDTENWAILAAGWACRVRRRDGQEEVTLKSLHGPTGSVHVRSEISQAAGTDHAESSPLSLSAGPVKHELDKFLDGKAVMELFRVESRRTVFELERTDPAPMQIEVDLDESRIEAPKTTDKATGILEFTELELEARTGDAADLETIAATLRDEAGLTPAQYSKFERGLQAAGLEMDTLLGNEQPVAIDEDEPVLTLLYHFLEEQLEIMRRQHPRALEGIDPEGVHQMRVATRRTRAIMKAFRELLGEERVSLFNGELRWLARNLGRARDADVTEKGAQDTGEIESGDYERFLQRETIRAYEHLVDVLQDERCKALEDALDRFISAGPTRDMREQYGDLSIAECARQFINAALANLLAHGDAITPDSPAEKLHKLRIEAKRFRYLLDFFSTVQGDRWMQTTEAVRKLQDVLGEHQDAVTAQAQLAGYAASVARHERDREKLLVTGRLLQKEEQRIVATRHQFAETWSDFKALVC